MEKEKKDTHKSSSFPIITCLILVLVIVGVLVFSLTRRQNQTNELNLSGNDALTIARVRLASAKNALDGTGEFTVEDCKALGSLAKQYNSSTDYFSSCTEASANLMYLSTPDTNNTKVLRLSDDNFTATFVTAKDQDKLSNYAFENIKSAGFNKYGGRR